MQSPKSQKLIAKSLLYLISPPTIELAKFLPELESAFESDLVAVFQLRLKNLEMQDLRAVIPPVRELCRFYGVPFLLNDYVHLAADMGCDGVHIGQKDMTMNDARAVMGDDAIIGVTCHDSKDLAFDAAEAGADYVAFGAFYPTKTKDYGFRPTPDLLRDWSELTTVPCVAIGGITPDNAAPLVDAGADFIAVVSAVWDHPDGAKIAVEGFSGILKKQLP